MEAAGVDALCCQGHYCDVWGDVNVGQLKLQALLKGLATYLPVVRELACRGSGGTISARYCYSVWLRHLVKAHEMGLAAHLHRVAELGPGDSLGIGLAAMLSGVDHYYAFDARRHAYAQRNLDVFAELVDLFSRRVPIPDEVEFPLVFPRLAKYEFPQAILTEEVLNASLQPERLGAIRQALRGTPAANSSIRIVYAAPWDDSCLMESGVIDMIFSQAVLEHVENVGATYVASYRWLRPGGFMSHTIDFKSHGLTRDWNGHWTVSDLLWKIVLGTRPYLINRLSHSAHIAEMEKAGFQIVADLKREGSPLSRRLLAPRFRTLSDDDLQTSAAFIQAVKLACRNRQHEWADSLHARTHDLTMNRDL